MFSAAQDPNLQTKESSQVTCW